MAKSIKWTAEKYKIAVRGDELPGLRVVVRGFEASDGYDLRRIDEWSTSQKRRVRKYYAMVHHLEAQEKVIVRPRSKANLEALKEAFHGDIPSKMFKAAFVPYTQPKGLPGAKQRAPKIRYLETGISIDAGAYERLFVPFDKKKLVKNAAAEIERVIAAMPGARMFFIQVGEFQTLNDKGRRTLTDQVLHYMNLYDGRKALPIRSGNTGDDPKHHHWKYWLNGVIGFIFPKKLNVERLRKQITLGMQAAKDRRKVQDKVMKSKRKR